jgi:hypothetical protein
MDQMVQSGYIKNRLQHRLNQNNKEPYKHDDFANEKWRVTHVHYTSESKEMSTLPPVHTTPIVKQN